MNCSKILIVLFLIGFVIIGITAENEDDDTDDNYSIADDCCDEGEGWVETGCEPPPDPERTQGCLDSGQACCRRMLQEKEDCRHGIEMAKEKGNCDDGEGQTIRCCEECRIGISLSQGGTGNCGTKDGGALYECCQYSMSKQETNNSEENEKPEEKEGKEEKKDVQPTTTVKADTPTRNYNRPQLNSCELEGDELCAHKCIPTGSSYKCQCRPGFKLRPDGHSCQKMDINRCQKNNPCEQKCADTGDAIICSCKRGFELMADNISCIDLDECELQLHNCKAESTCVNTPGSFRCVKTAKEPSVGKSAGPKAAQPSCPKGYQLNTQNQVCDDINECLSNPCPAGLVCVNTVGSFSCGHSPTGPSPSSSGAVPIPAPEVPYYTDACPQGFRLDEDNSECADIDECAEGTDDCNKMSQFCLNTHGRFTCQNKASKTSCPAGFKIRPDFGCDDIDECAENSELCTPDSVCVNEPGGYDCKVRGAGGLRPKPRPQLPLPQPPARTNPTRPPIPVATPRVLKMPHSSNCPRGYRKSPNGGCMDIDECAENTHTCDGFQDCHNIMGGHRCICKKGFNRDPITQACTDINECQRDELNDCSETQRCDNTVGSYHCIRYISCGTGYTLNSISSTCEDDDECQLGTHDCGQMGNSYECLNMPGTYRCVRKRIIYTTTTSTAAPIVPYEYDSEEYYTDTEEALPKPENIPKPEEKNNRESPNIPTPKTTTKEPERQSENNNVEEKPTTPPAATFVSPDDVKNVKDPRNDPNSYYPIEPKAKPEEVDKEEPEAFPGANVYYPNPRYPPRPFEDPRIYRPAEPRIESVTVPDERKSVTLVGSPDNEGNIVVDTKELQGNTWTNLVPGAKRCIQGYIMDSTGECIDIDECKTGRHICAANSEICRNSPGGYTCLCAPGFFKDEKTGLCRSRGQLIPPEPAVPKWSIQRVSCDIGFHIDPVSRQCVDTDECVDGTLRCAINEECINTMGGYRCQCSPGYKLVGERCLAPTPPPPTRPQHQPVRITSPPRYHFCSWGYKLENNRCVDVDECATNTHSCKENQQCSNIPGGFLCHCSPGHRILSDGNCRDIDECQESHGKVCSHHSNCINTIGSFECSCHEGFTTSSASKQLCNDIDECAANSGLGPCHQKCVNIWGSYRCACEKGYRLAVDNRTCVDMDECAEPERRLCVGECVNIPGSYQCTCPKGYRMGGDKRSCIDIDECENGELVCGPDHVCQNTRGGARCSSVACPPGYFRDPGSKHRCRRPPGSCSISDYSCFHRPETYSFNFITFVSRLYIPTGPRAQVDLFTMRGPNWPDSMLSFQLHLLNVRAPQGIPTADMSCFKLTPSPQQALVSLVKPLIGPQDIHLELSMELYRLGNFEGTAVAKIFIYVSEHEF